MLVRHLGGGPSAVVRATQRRDRSAPEFFDAADPDCDLKTLLESGGGVDFVINAAGITKPNIDESDRASVERAKTVNSRLPWRLAESARACGARLIHLSTDGVFSGRNGPYDEAARPDPDDVYGRSKLAGEPVGPGVLTIRCSIVGPDPDRGRGLYEWVRGLTPGVAARGFVDQLWNGVTTCQFADLCRALMQPAVFDHVAGVSPLRHLCPNPPLTKYDLVASLARTIGSDAVIEPVASGVALNRTLTTRWNDLDALAPHAPWSALLADLVTADPRGPLTTPARH
jgi:dTDP-4-dehydrorhamnose reductase